MASQMATTMIPHDVLLYISEACGWGYFFAWSISFYPQVVMNYQRKSISGLRAEFVIYNALGFAAYSTYCIVCFVTQKKEGIAQSMFVQDVLFAVHAWILTLITLGQVWWYRDTIDQPVTFTHTFLLAILTSVFFLEAALCALGTHPWTNVHDPAGGWSLTAICVLVKTFISVVKYLPQLFHNYSRRSTVGWSIENIWLDLTGGTLSFAQNFVQVVANQWNWQILVGNPGKLALSILAIVFDLLFLHQHYLLYPGAEDEALALNRDLDEGHGALAKAPRLLDSKALANAKDQHVVLVVQK